MIIWSFWRKAIVTTVAACGFVSLYEVTTLDSKYAARQATLHETTALPSPGARLAFSATAYCKGIVTAVRRRGAERHRRRRPAAAAGRLRGRDRVAAAEVQRHLHHPGHRAGGAGARGGHLHVELQRGAGVRPPADSPHRAAPGMEPAATTPSFLDRFFKRAEPAPLPSRPLPLSPRLARGWQRSYAAARRG